MKITSARLVPYSVPLSRPYSIARRRIDSVELFYIEVQTDQPGLYGLGAASPAPGVTGEEPEACARALSQLDFLIGKDGRRFAALQAMAAEKLSATPAALAACDMALWDLAGKALEQPVVDLLGDRIEPLPTSITIGIKSKEEMLEEAAEYLERGFTCLKVKIGDDYEADVRRLEALRRLVGEGVKIRVDANQGYAIKSGDSGSGDSESGDSESGDRDVAGGLPTLIERFDLELVEQPFERGQESAMSILPADLRRLLAADESLHGAADALKIAGDHSHGILNIKLMKCGGISGAQRIAAIAEAGGLELMWGCMDESVVSIAAALHVAMASPATRYLDLDGSFDLPSDLATGGFELRGDRLHWLDRPGLGVEWADQA